MTGPGSTPYGSHDVEQREVGDMAVLDTSARTTSYAAA